MSRDISQKLDQIFDAYRGPGRPGGVVAVVKNSEIVYQHAFGLADLEGRSEFTPATPFHICSCTKQYTAAAILLLEHEGLLKLDDLASQHLPWMPDVGNLITIRHLCTNTSGLRDYLLLPMLANGGLSGRLTREMTTELIISQRSLMFRPGEDYRYSNTNFVLLGWIIERLTNRSLAEVFEELLFRPVAMTSSVFLEHSQPGPVGAAVGYISDGKGGWLAPRTDIYEAGDGGVWSTLEDLIRWELNIPQNRIGPKDLFPRLSAPMRLNDGFVSWYAYGHGTGTYGGAKWFGHAGGLSGMTVNRAHFPDERLSIIVAGNSAQFDAEAATFVLAKPFLGSVVESAEPFTPLRASEAEPWLGAYQSADAAHTAELLLVNGEVFLRLGASAFSVARDAIGQWVDEGRFYRAKVEGNCLTIIPGRGRPLTLLRLPQPEGALASFVGQYVSTELASTYEITALGGQLMLDIRGPLGQRSDIPLLQIGRDVFHVARRTEKHGLVPTGPIITFEREAGRVFRLLISISKAERNTFRKSK